MGIIKINPIIHIISSLLLTFCMYRISEIDEKTKITYIKIPNVIIALAPVQQQILKNEPIMIIKRYYYDILLTYPRFSRSTKPSVKYVCPLLIT